MPTLDFSDLYGYQVRGVEFLTAPYDPPHRYLADDCGLGKTYQAVAATVKVQAPSALVITEGTVGVRETWARAYVDWGYCAEHEIQILYKTSDVVDPHAKLVILSHDLTIYKQLADQLKRRFWGVVIVDEAHRYKTFTAARTKAVLGKNGLVGYGFYKWLFSATPIPNNSIELYPAVSTLMPSTIDNMSYEEFGLKFCNGYWDTSDNSYGVEFITKGSSNEAELRQRLRPFMLCRELQNEFKDIPPVVGETIYLDLGELPYNKHNTPIARLQKYIGLDKVPQIVEYVRNWLASNPGKKLIVFAYHQDVLKELYSELGGYVDTFLIYGKVSRKQRNAEKQGFIDSKYQSILLLQISCGGTALDGLQKVCHNIVFAEPDWSYGKVKQGVGRVLRHGQGEITYVKELIAIRTMDETKIGSCYRKQEIADAVIPKEMTIMTPENETRMLDLLERFVICCEDFMGALEDAGNSPAASTGGGSKRKRRTKAEIEAEKALSQAPPTAPQQVVGVAQTAPAATPSAASAPGAVPTPVHAQAPVNGQAVTFQDVQLAASNAVARIKTQMSPLDPEAALHPANALMSTKVHAILGRHAAFAELANEPDKWATAVAVLNAANYEQPQAQQAQQTAPQQPQLHLVPPQAQAQQQPQPQQAPPSFAGAPGTPPQGGMGF